MDLVGSAVSAIVGRLCARALVSIFGPESQASGPPELELDEEIFEFKSQDDITVGVITEAQFADIDTFVETPQVGSVIQAWCVLRVGDFAEAEKLEALGKLQDTFESLAVQWCSQSGQDWLPFSQVLWVMIAKSLESIAANIRRYQLSSRDRREIFERFTTGSQLLNLGQRTAPRFVRELVATLGDSKRIVALKQAIYDICEHVEARFSEMQLSHTHDDYRFELAQLYVDRTLKRRADDEVVSSKIVLSPGRQNPRVVIIGDPGVGKTTLLRHLVHATIVELEATVAPLLFQCREYAGEHWGSSFVQFLRGRLDVEYSLTIEEALLVDVFSSGSATLIVDGIDEITDIQKRREMVRKVESFSRRYPLVPVLVTSRKVGYERAQFQPNYFQLYELDEFSHGQFIEYTRRWFEITGRSDSERQAFIRESNAVTDIRSNPLILSLLCTLYRARGHIPRNRRQVYRECSELLFQRWDSMRQIEQPFDHRQYGQRLMQELARFFYGSQNAQAGIEEEQLKRLIAHFFEDTAGVEPPESLTRAGMFLEFCADRAWLLSAKGTSPRGQRLFSFTHRTFMEYMAAEALVRNARDIDQIVDEVIKIYESDPSSVLSDVIVQCSEDKIERGAEQILTELLRRARKVARYGDSFLALCLRIVNSAPMSARISRELPKSVQEFWDRIDNVDRTRTSSVSFFELYRDPRSRMIRAMADDQVDISDFSPAVFRESVCSRWARFESVGVVSHFENEWASQLEPHFRKIVEELKSGEHFSSVIVNYAIKKRLLTVSDFDGAAVRPDWIVPAFGEFGPGVATTTVLAAVRGEQFQPEILDWLAKEIGRKRTIDPDVAMNLSWVLDDEVRIFGQAEFETVRARIESVPNLGDVLLWLSFITCEARDNILTVFHEAIRGVVGIPDFLDLVATRESRLGLQVEDESGNVLTRKRAAELLANFPSWAMNWVNGAQFVKEVVYYE